MLTQCRPYRTSCVFGLAASCWLVASIEAATVPEMANELLTESRQDLPPGKVLFREDFTEGLARWNADPGWSVVADPEGKGRCARVVSSDEFEDLILRQKLSIVPGHPVAVCYRARSVSGSASLYLRVDFFDAEGKTGKPYARQRASQQGVKWTDNTVLVSDWFPDYTRSITVHFHQAPKSHTTSLLSRVVVVDLAPAIEARVHAETQRFLKVARSLKEKAAVLPDTAVNRWWRKVVASRSDGLVQALKRAAAMADVSAQQEAAAGAGATVTRLARVLSGLAAGVVKTERLAAFNTTPTTSVMVLPWSGELDVRSVGKARMTACPGEFESTSLVLWAPERVERILPTVTDLRGPAGVITRDSIDLKWVKCWYQAGSAPHGVRQDRSRKVLVPELLLNDDSLVRVDLQKQRNFLKLSFPTGARYVPIDDPTPPKPAWGFAYKLSEFPVKDSATLLPTDLPAQQNKQLWLTLHVPTDAKPGEYSGRVRVVAAGASVGAIRLDLRVLPFTLPAPRTHYDPAREYTGSLYYWGELDPKGAGTIGYKLKSEQQFRAELRTMFTHNIVAPAMIWSPKIVYDNEPLFRRQLALMKATGMAGRPLYTADSGMIGNPTDPKALAALKERVRKTIRIASEYGFRGVYFYGLDEAQGDRLLSQRPAWRAVHEAGGKVFVSGYAGHLKAVGDLLDQINRAGDPITEDVGAWHKQGHRVWNYGNPQTPVEDPEVYRRNYGLDDWRLDLDGVCTYCFMDSSGVQWNDFDCDAYRDHCLAYPTVDGVIGTLALEGLREGLDDVKYATLLLQLVARRERSSLAAAQADARAVRRWLDGLDMRHADLDEIRRELVDKIVRLLH